MGSGIAQIRAQAGYQTVVREVEQEMLDRGMQSIQRNLDRAVAKEKMTQPDADAVLGRLTATLDLAEFEECDLVIEAIVENLEAKNDLFASLGEICKASRSPSSCAT